MVGGQPGRDRAESVARRVEVHEDLVACGGYLRFEALVRSNMCKSLYMYIDRLKPHTACSGECSDQED